MENDKLVQITNMAGHTVFYNLPERNVKRVFSAGESKKISEAEVEALSYIEGGRYLLENYLRIEDAETLNELNIEPEEEYTWTKKDVEELLLKGSIERLEDALEFAPAGIIDLIKDTAVNLKIADINKRDLITKKTGLNITSAIKNAEDSTVVEEKPKRRAKSTTTAKTRRAATTSAKAPVVEE